MWKWYRLVTLGDMRLHGFGYSGDTAMVRFWLPGGALSDSPNTSSELLLVEVLLKYILPCHPRLQKLGAKHASKWYICPSGPTGSCLEPYYIYIAGDVIGWGSINSQKGHNITSCAGLCDANPNCCSFEFSPRTKTCNLNWQCQPTAKVFQDYNFCVKGNHIVIFEQSTLQNCIL